MNKKILLSGVLCALLPFAAIAQDEEVTVVGSLIKGTPIDVAFIGSCTNSRIEDLRNVAEFVKGRKVNSKVHAMIVPGSGLVKNQAEEEGLHHVFVEAGFEWREPGCSMCLAMNDDILQPGERCASTSNCLLYTSPSPRDRQKSG